MTADAISPRRRMLAVCLFLAALSVGLFGWSLAEVFSADGAMAAMDPSGRFAALVALHSLAPRYVVGLLAGAALGLAGALLQSVLRNTLADPSSLGVAAGAHLAIVAMTAFAPELGGFPREGVAFAGGLMAVLIVLGLSWRRAFEPATVVVAGMMVGLLCASLAATLILYSGQYLTSLFLWGGGSLAQQNWTPAVDLAVRFVPAFAVSMLFLRSLSLLTLDDQGARALGLSVAGTRLAILVLAVALSAAVVSQVGVIGFIGLAAPNLARLMGARTARPVLLLSPLLGALMLSVTDGIVQAIDRASRFDMPTGAVTALFAGPVLLWLSSRLRAARPDLRAEGVAGAPRRRLWPVVLGGLAVSAALALLVGRSESGIGFDSLSTIATLLPWRAPRLVAAMAGGAMLATAGCLLQRMTSNPLASPEVLGVSSSAILAMAICVFAVPSMGLAGQMTAATLGAMLGFAVLIAAARRGAFEGNRMLLGGVALGSFCGAALTILMTRGGMEAGMILAWLTGATAHVDPVIAGVTAVLAILLILPALVLSRWLDLLALGKEMPAALGLAMTRARLVLLALAALLTGAAALTLGPVSFVGLMAPHIARHVGAADARSLLATSAALGALLMGVADLASRLAFYPYQMPIGLFASLIGTPYLLYMLARR
ncbi:iron complex transport system permease protein [Angulomicrobium tetraedrale]|uniref:Iron complex transport system permease protein n=1 Tax=Ancylobacter tetraedralis TaxID=217068 RepID=A0A839ZCY8_9HYPH|nr:Fe(3+)-hydroxamate ABC transporter permease FhuB [Ancylobacter tetraedralis]MBB3772536.1 iron complex transport system permease protein [Ancylobacter tetraedralis]